MDRFNGLTLAVLFLRLIGLNGCQDLLPRDTQSLLIPRFQKSEIFGFVAGFGTTFAAVPDLIAMFRRRSSVGINPRMAAILGVFQVLWVYYGLLILSRPVIAWNVVAVLINFLSVGAYSAFRAQRKSSKRIMNGRFCLLALVLLIAMPLYARDKTDIMVMTNGDRLTCEVKGLDAGVLYVSFDYIDGTAFVNWSMVARLESKQLFVGENGKAARSTTGILRTPDAPADRPVKIQVLAAEKEDTPDRAQIVQMVATSDSFWQRFNGEVSFGVIYSKGNQSTQYTLTSQTAYVRERWSAIASFEFQPVLQLGHQCFHSKLSHFWRPSSAALEQLVLCGYGGLSAKLRTRNRICRALWVVVSDVTLRTRTARIFRWCSGLPWQNTAYKQSVVPVNNQKLAAAIFFGQAQFFKFSKTNLDVTGSVLPALSDPGRVRFNTNASYYIKIVSNLKWNMSFYGNWDNRPPPGFSGSDYGTSSGLSWTFGLK